MSAKDYKICPALFSAYIAKVSKRNPNEMTNDRREITENEILGLFYWWIKKKAKGEVGHTEIITIKGNPIMEIKYLKEESHE